MAVGRCYGEGGCGDGEPCAGGAVGVGRVGDAVFLHGGLLPGALEGGEVGLGGVGHVGWPGFGVALAHGGAVMQGALGERIGAGMSADVHGWAPGRVVKLFKVGMPRRVVWHEARMTRVAFEAGLPAPEVFGEVEVEGRFGIVLARLEGPTLLELSRSGAMSAGEVGGVLAGLAMAVHATVPPVEVISLRDWMEHSLRAAGERVPAHIGAGIVGLIERMGPGEGWCHGDLHPGNVIMTAEGPRLVDWLGAVRAPGVLDLAICHVLLFEHTPGQVDDPERPRAYHAVLEAEYARLGGISLAALRGAVEGYLPVAGVLGLLGGWADAEERARFIGRVEAALGMGG